MSKKPETPSKQLLHLVIGGEVVGPEPGRVQGPFGGRSRRGLSQLQDGLRRVARKAQQTVDNAEMRYFIVHLHRLLEPGIEG